MRLLVVWALAALQLLFVVAISENRAPAARPGIARAGAVGVDGDALVTRIALARHHLRNPISWRACVEPYPDAFHRLVKRSLR